MQDGNIISESKKRNQGLQKGNCVGKYETHFSLFKSCWKITDCLKHTEHRCFGNACGRKGTALEYRDRGARVVLGAPHVLHMPHM